MGVSNEGGIMGRVEEGREREGWNNGGGTVGERRVEQ